MLQCKETKDWTKDLAKLKEKILSEGELLKEEKQGLIAEITASFNDAIIDIRERLIELGFEENPDHFSHEISCCGQFEGLWIYKGWKIYLGKTKNLVLMVDLCGSKGKNSLDEMPNVIYLTMPRWNYRDEIYGVSIKNLYLLFNDWLEEVSLKIVVKGLEELKINLTL